MNILLLAVLPFLHPGNMGEVRVKSQSEEVLVLLTMENCPPCEVMKVELDNKSIYLMKNTSECFHGFTQGKVRQFPSLGVWYKNKVNFYFGVPKIRQFLRSRNQ